MSAVTTNPAAVDKQRNVASSVTTAAKSAS
jgi:hypothetical protein